MNSQPLVSVVVNTFNSTRYLDETLASLQAQTYPHWELVLWDNRSDDGTVELARRCADARTRIFIAPQRMPLAEGRNQAIAQARGEWIALLDHDDPWSPQKLQMQVDLVAASADPAAVGLVYARTRSFSSRGDEGETIHRFTGRPLPEGRILQVLLEQGCLIPLPSAMIRRDAWEKVGPIPSHLKFAEDYWLFAAIAEYFEVRCVQTACCFYRVHPESETARNRVLSHIESLEVLERWRYQLTPAAYRRRRRICHTLWATEMVRKERRVWAGLTKLTRDGSLPFLLRGCCSVAIRQFLLNRRPVS